MPVAACGPRICPELTEFGRSRCQCERTISTANPPFMIHEVDSVPSAFHVLTHSHLTCTKSPLPQHPQIQPPQLPPSTSPQRLRNAPYLVTPALGSPPQVNQQRLRLPATLRDGRLRLRFRSSELWAEAGLEQEPPALRLMYDWQHALSLQLSEGYRAHVVGLCGNFNWDPTDDVDGPDPRAFLRTWALQPPDAACHALWAAPCAQTVSPPETPGPCAILAALNGPFSPCHDVLLPAPFETSCSAWICPFPNYRPALCLTLQVYAHACQRLGVSIDSWRFQAGCRE